MSMNVIYAQSVDSIKIDLYPLTEQWWVLAMDKYKSSPIGRKIVFYSMTINYIRHDFMIEKLANGWNYYYFLSYDGDYSVYEWDTSIYHTNSHST